MTDDYFKDLVPEGFGPTFHLHAAPQAIEANIQVWMKKRQKAEETLAWLRHLQAHRATQVMNGEWPGPGREEG